MNKLSLSLLAVCLLNACAYNNKAYVPHPADGNNIGNKLQIQAAERAERKEARQDRREEMMDAAEAYNRAHKGLPPKYIIY